MHAPVVVFEGEHIAVAHQKYAGARGSIHALLYVVPVGQPASQVKRDMKQPIAARCSRPKLSGQGFRCRWFQAHRHLP